MVWTVRIPQDLAAWIDEHAKNDGRSRNNLVRLALNKYRQAMEQNVEPVEPAKAAASA
jgi:metal-responsive CopG/Arc/MetJ family transcriptional regulator